MKYLFCWLQKQFPSLQQFSETQWLWLGALFGAMLSIPLVYILTLLMLRLPYRACVYDSRLTIPVNLCENKMQNVRPRKLDVVPPMGVDDVIGSHPPHTSNSYTTLRTKRLQYKHTSLNSANRIVQFDPSLREEGFKNV